MKCPTRCQTRDGVTHFCQAGSYMHAGDHRSGDVVWADPVCVRCGVNLDVSYQSDYTTLIDNLWTKGTCTDRCSPSNDRHTIAPGSQNVTTIQSSTPPLRGRSRSTAAKEVFG